MNGRSNVPEKRSTAALAAGMAVAVYTAAVVLLVGGIALPAAHAAGDERDRDHDGGRGDGNRGARDDHHDGRGRDWREREARNRYEQEHYWRYQRPVYVPPPVTYYPPPASPGITLVLPLEFRIR